MIKLGLVTHTMATDWDLATVIDRCTKAGFEGVELRTTHAHGVEPSLGKRDRKAVKETFRKSPVRLVSLGTTCEYHAVNREEVLRNIEVTKQFVELAYDVGAIGVKVRPNSLQTEKGVPADVTTRQIGFALRECGEFAQKHGVEIWLEVHGEGTADLRCMKQIMEVADHKSVGVCWNSNKTDLVDGSITKTFPLVERWMRSVHIHELWDKSYPWRELFGLLKAAGYDRYCFAEIPPSPDPERLMKYYRALFEELTR